MGAHITGWGAGLPSRELDNTALAAILDVEEEWIFQRTGIRSRRVVADGQTTSSLATEASRRAIERAGLSPEQIDLVLVATSTPDYQLPATACLVQAALGCTHAAAFDLNAACAGFLYALAQATAVIDSGAYERVLVCGADTLSLVTDYSDARSCILFGDGAGAVVVERTDAAGGLGPFILRADGSQPELLYVRPDERLIKMQGREVYRRAIDAMASVLEEVVGKSGLRLDDVDLFVAHQANARIVEAVAARLGLDETKLALNIESLGNTSAASIPLALVDAADRGVLAPGDVVALTAFGAGFAWGAGLIRWGPPRDVPRPRRRLPELVGTIGHLVELT